MKFLHRLQLRGNFMATNMLGKDGAYGFVGVYLYHGLWIEMEKKSAFLKSDEKLVPKEKLQTAEFPTAVHVCANIGMEKLLKISRTTETE